MYDTKSLRLSAGNKRGVQSETKSYESKTVHMQTRYFILLSPILRIGTGGGLL
jgi:hypothetical protein